MVLQGLLEGWPQKAAPPEPEGSSGATRFIPRASDGGQTEGSFLSLFLGWRCAARIGHDRAVNQESLDRANAFLAAVAGKLPPGELVELSPAEIGREIGVSEPLAAARAMRALLARRRLEIVDHPSAVLGPPATHA